MKITEKGALPLTVLRSQTLERGKFFRGFFLSVNATDLN